MDLMEDKWLQKLLNAYRYDMCSVIAAKRINVNPLIFSDLNLVNELYQETEGYSDDQLSELALEAGVSSEIIEIVTTKSKQRIDAYISSKSTNSYEVH